MNTKGNTMKLPTGYIPLTHEEMELVEGGGKLTVHLRASSLRKGLVSYSTVYSAIQGCALSYAGPIGAIAGVVWAMAVPKIVKWAAGKVKKDIVFSVNLGKKLKQNKTVTI